jgi:hypothetical protein
MSATTILQKVGESVSHFIDSVAKVDLQGYELELDSARLAEARTNLIDRVDLVFEELSKKFPEVVNDLNCIKNKIKLFKRKIKLGMIDLNLRINYSLYQDPSSETSIGDYLQEIIYGIKGGRHRSHIFKDFERFLDGEFDVKK